jgi:hypothetical protein
MIRPAKEMLLSSFVILDTWKIALPNEGDFTITVCRLLYFDCLLKTLHGNVKEEPKSSVVSWLGLRLKKLCNKFSEIVIEEGRLSKTLGFAAVGCWAKLVA